MPYAKRKNPRGGYNIINTQTGKVHAKGTSSLRADRQLRLLRGVEHGTFKPTGKSAGKRYRK
jgi:hypothetical protein